MLSVSSLENFWPSNCSSTSSEVLTTLWRIFAILKSCKWLSEEFLRKCQYPLTSTNFFFAGLLLTPVTEQIYQSVGKTLWQILSGLQYWRSKGLALGNTSTELSILNLKKSHCFKNNQRPISHPSRPHKTLLNLVRLSFWRKIKPKPTIAELNCPMRLKYIFEK